MHADIANLFKTLTGYEPMPWQRRLLDQLLDGRLPSALDLPTGLSKTSVMAIWLLARASACESQLEKIPRRLIYVVDRRAVVDQATAEADKLAAAIDSNLDLRTRLGLSGSLPVSTLRGQHANNRAWLADPASPAIIVGTVDMIGSRLLFEGYGVSRRMRPYHAGLLGTDALIVLDEAHLVPPFEALLARIETSADELGPQEGNQVPPFRLLSLSATGRMRSKAPESGEGSVFSLNNEDRRHAVVQSRLEAIKILNTVDIDNQDLAPALADQAWKLSGEGKNAIRCLIYADSRSTAEQVGQKLRSLAKGASTGGAAGADVELLVGTRRVREREQVQQWLERHGFLAGSEQEFDRPAFLIATSAGEVGIDLDADHVVCDLVEWERMVQRLGRVNRRGGKQSKVIVVHGPEPQPKKPDAPNAAEQRALRIWRSLSVLRQLREKDKGRDASPAALLELNKRAASCEELRQQITAATSPEPLRPALSRALVDAWAMTSLDDHPGRPAIQPWLRGWVEDEPQTTVIWRRHLPLRDGFEAAMPGKADQAMIEAFFEATPPHLSEMLETESDRVAKWLSKRAGALVTNAGAGRNSKGLPEDHSGAVEGDAGPQAAQQNDEPTHDPLGENDIAAILLKPDGGFDRVTCPPLVSRS